MIKLNLAASSSNRFQRLFGRLIACVSRFAAVVVCDYQSKPLIHSKCPTFDRRP